MRLDHLLKKSSVWRQIDTPTTVSNYDQIIWFLLHQEIWVYIDVKNRWYIQFNTLLKDQENKASIDLPNEDQIKHLFRDEKDLYVFLAQKRPKTFERIRQKLEIPFTRRQLLK